MLDIDFFKKINDQYGHDSGDKVLTQLIYLIKQLCDKNDWVVRWGGEEFVVVLNNIPRDKLLQKAELINQTIAAHYFMISQQQKLKCTCSIGVVSFPFSLTEPDALTWQETLNVADFALYKVKNNGRNHCAKISIKRDSDIKSQYLAHINQKNTAVHNSPFKLQNTKSGIHKMLKEI